MNETMTITLRTLTPLWTGGVDGTSDRLHATGIIGSLRWWYEAIVRGMGGYVSNPAAEAEDEISRAEFDTKAYEEAKREGKSDEEAIQAGLHTLCPVSYLFGATGWARLFQLQVLDAPTTPLHFVTNLPMNEGWLERIFGGETQNINNLKVPFGNTHLRLVPRGYDTDYAVRQIVLVFRVATEYGGLGARLQHGFGQAELDLPQKLQDNDIDNGLQELNQRITGWSSPATPDPSPFNLRYFVSQTYEVPERKLGRFRTTVGTRQSSQSSYVPCVFDLRYKGNGRWGMRRWLKEQKGWRESDDPKKLGPLDELMGPRSRWGHPSQEKSIDDDLRTAGRIYFGMPYQLGGHSYRLRVFGFAHPWLLTPEELSNLCQEYMNYVLDIQPHGITFGNDLISPLRGVSS